MIRKKLVKVKDHRGLVRDASSGAILNINTDEIHKAKIAKQARRDKKHEIEQIKSDMSTLKDDMSEIKELLKRIITSND